MKFKELKFKGVYLISNIKINDNRGYFSRIYCESEFKKKKLIQNGFNSISHLIKRDTLLEVYIFKKNLTRK